MVAKSSNILTISFFFFPKVVMGAGLQEEIVLADMEAVAVAVDMVAVAMVDLSLKVI